MDVARIVSELTGRPWQRDVDDIVAHVQVTAEDGALTSTLLLVRWAGYDDSHNSWLYADDVRASDYERYFSGETTQLADACNVVGNIDYLAGTPVATKKSVPSGDKKGKGKPGRGTGCADQARPR